MSAKSVGTASRRSFLSEAPSKVRGVRNGTALTVGSLFAGVGGFDLGFQRAGMRTEWFVEIDPYCQAVLRKHWPEVPIYEDVRDVGSRNLRAVDVVCGGFPS